MLATDAAQTLRSLAYKPGWSFDAQSFEELSPRSQFAAEMTFGGVADMDNLIMFRWQCDTVDTDRENAINDYAQPRTLDDVVPLDASTFENSDQLLFAVFQMIMRLELHESREFFRCKDRDWNAPFHPHRAEGEALWERCMDETN